MNFKKIKLYAFKENLKKITLNQYEHSVCKLCFELFCGDKPIDLTTFNEIRFYALKPDGTIIGKACTVENNEAVLSVPLQLTVVPGIAKCTVECSNLEGNVRFGGMTIEVIPSQDSESAIESTDEFTLLETTIAEAEQIISKGVLTDEHLAKAVENYFEEISFTSFDTMDKIISACCDTEVISVDNYNLFKISEVEFSSRLQNDAEDIISSSATNVVTDWFPVAYGKYYALSTLHEDVGRTTERNHFPRVQLQLNDGTIKLYTLQAYPNTGSSDTKILGVDHEDAVAMRIQFQVLDSNKTAQDISSSDLLKAYKPMLVEGNTAEEARQNAINLEYLDGDEEVPAEVEYKLKSDYTKAEKTTVDNLESRVDTLERLDTSMLYEAQKSIADDWRIPFVDVFHKLGLGSNHIIPNSYDTWGGTGNDLTQKGIMMSDGIHPSLGDGVTMMYAQAIIPQLKIVPPLYSADSEYDDWTGKNILWMGTSIPAGSDSTLGVEGIGTTYPAITANKLGATCTNIAKGSSCVRINSSSGDYNKFAYHHFIRALSRTKAEADLLQVNWDSVKANITSAADTISDSDLEIMKAHSFETMLLPYLNGTKTMPDLFVIDHGHNDIRPVGTDGK